MRGKSPVPGWSPLIHQMIALLYIWIYNILMIMLLVLIIFFLYHLSTGQISFWSLYFFAFVPTNISSHWPSFLAQIGAGRVLVFSQISQR